MSLLLEHTSSTGTVLDGTARGDGAAEIAKAHGWRWGRSIGMWYLPRSIDNPPRRRVIEATAAALLEAGFEVEVQVDAASRDQVEADRRVVERAAARQARLGERAERLAGVSDAHEKSAQRLGEGIPFGQPILVGHHSEGAHRRRLERIQGHARRSVEAQQAASQAQEAAQASRSHLEHRADPHTVARRVDHLEAEERQLVARLKQSGHYASEHALSSEYRQQLVEALEHARGRLEHWRAVRASQVVAGEVVEYSRATVAAGDAVRVRSGWYQVVRANKATVTVSGRFGESRVRYHEIRGHRAAAVGRSGVERA